MQNPLWDLISIAIGLILAAIAASCGDIPSALVALSTVLIASVSYALRNNQKLLTPISRVIRVIVSVCIVGFAAGRLILRVVIPQPSVTPPVAAAQPPTSSLTATRIRINSDIDYAEEGVVLVIKAYNPSNTVNGQIRYPRVGSVWSVHKGDEMPLDPEIRIPNEEDVIVEALLVALPKAATIEVVDLIESAFDVLTSNYESGSKLTRAINAYALSKVTEATKEALEDGRFLGAKVMRASDISRRVPHSMGNDAFELLWDMDNVPVSNFGVYYPNGQPLEPTPEVTIVTTTIRVSVVVPMVHESIVLSPTLACPRHELCITSPKQDTTLTSSQPSVEVWGTATKNDFSRYEFTIESPSCSNGYCVMSSYTQPVVNGKLMTLDIAEFPELADGAYWIRLIVIDNSGNTYPEVAKFHVNVSR